MKISSKNDLRIVQLIDSLEIGGAERMAVNYANALLSRVGFSGLVTTRNEGLLKDKLNRDVSYLFLNRTRKIDFTSLLLFVKYCKTNRISHIHAHGTSFFTAVLTKILHPSIKIIWHDHNGNRAFSSGFQNNTLRIFSNFFSGIIVVNKDLEVWAKQKLACPKVLFLSNFVVKETVSEGAILKGVANKRILCLANIRWQKNQTMLVEVADCIKNKYPDWTFHCVGNGLETDYGQQVQNLCKEKGLENSVFFYDGIADNATVINQAAICVLTSVSEGLPVVVLEYGLYSKPVIVTAVGELPELIINKVNGGIVSSNASEEFCELLSFAIENIEVREKWSAIFHQQVIENYTEDQVLSNYLNWILNSHENS
jgi:glycosyltransferase involved in cell wall biosynthesis